MSLPIEIYLLSSYILQNPQSVLRLRIYFIRCTWLWSQSCEWIFLSPYGQILPHAKNVEMGGVVSALSELRAYTGAWDIAGHVMGLLTERWQEHAAGPLTEQPCSSRAPRRKWVCVGVDVPPLEEERVLFQAVRPHQEEQVMHRATGRRRVQNCSEGWSAGECGPVTLTAGVATKTGPFP